MVYSESRDATRASTPPPLPPLYRRRAQDRASISSVSTTSTTASSVIVSPTTPTRQEWSSVRIVSPMARDWAARGSWSSQAEEEEVDTPKNSFLAVDAPSRSNSKSPVGDSENWWAGVSAIWHASHAEDVPQQSHRADDRPPRLCRHLSSGSVESTARECRSVA